MEASPASILRLPERVRQDVATYAAEVARFQRDEVNPVAFRAFRVPMGVYEHRAASRRGMTHGVPVLVPESLLDEASEIIADREGFGEFEDEEETDEEEDEEDFGLGEVAAGDLLGGEDDDEDESLFGDDEEDEDEDDEDL